jgi:hypothetical protein
MPPDKRKKGTPRQRVREESSGASMLRTYVAGLLLVNFFLWGIAVSMYQEGSGLSAPVTLPGRPRGAGGGIAMAIAGIGVFITSAVAALPQIAAVCSHTLSNRMWYAVLVAGVNLLLVLFMLWMKKVEGDLNSGRAFGNRKR